MGDDTLIRRRSGVFLEDDMDRVDDDLPLEDRRRGVVLSDAIVLRGLEVVGVVGVVAASTVVVFMVVPLLLDLRTTRWVVNNCTNSSLDNCIKSSLEIILRGGCA